VCEVYGCLLPQVVGNVSQNSNLLHLHLIFLLACFGCRAGYYLELEFEGSEDFSVRWGGRNREPVKEELVCRGQQLGMNM
jgi:hypothetical protein